jgi:thiamine biosynthesis protein ThiS
MNLYINGDERTFPDSPTPFTPAALIESLGMKSDRVAVELNRDIVPRDRCRRHCSTTATDWKSSTSSAAAVFQNRPPVG